MVIFTIWVLVIELKIQCTCDKYERSNSQVTIDCLFLLVSYKYCSFFRCQFNFEGFTNFDQFITSNSGGALPSDDCERRSLPLFHLSTWRREVVDRSNMATVVF